MTRPSEIGQLVGLALDHVRLAVSRMAACIAAAIELAVGLGARSPHGRPLAPVEHAELDAGRIGDPAHQPVQRVDLADQMALAEPADRRDCRTSRRRVAKRWVTSAVRAPMRAAALAASQPA